MTIAPVPLKIPTVAPLRATVGELYKNPSQFVGKQVQVNGHLVDFNDSTPTSPSWMADPADILVARGPYPPTVKDRAARLSVLGTVPAGIQDSLSGLVLNGFPNRGTGLNVIGKQGVTTLTGTISAAETPGDLILKLQ